MTQSLSRKNILQHHVAIPQDHGTWVFLLSPLLIGIFAGGDLSLATGLLVISSLAAFLIRQPITILVKIQSGRRPRRELIAAKFWTITYGLIALFGLIGLVVLGFGYVMLLAIPGIPVFAWHLWLVSRRAERRHIGVEVVASGVLSLTAPAAYWVGVGWTDPIGWWLFVLIWLQSAASIVYAYLRLEQRHLKSTPDRQTRTRMGRRALLYTTFNMVFVIIFSFFGKLPILLPIPYAVQWLETIWGTTHPAIGVKPTQIGMRQLIVSTLFTILFIITWNY